MPTLTIEICAPTSPMAKGQVRFAAAIVAAVSLHAGIALAWLGVGVTPIGGDGARLDAVAVTLTDGQALESVKPSILQAQAGQHAPLAERRGSVVEVDVAAASTPAESKLDVVEPPPPVDDPAVMIMAELQSPRLPLEPPMIEPPQSIAMQPSTSGSTTSRAEAAATPVDAAAGASPGAIDAYRSRLTAALSKTQPPNRGTAGTVRVVFTVALDGSLDAVSISASSGHATLDQLALAAVRRARLPAPHAAMTQSQRTFPMRYVFK